MGSLQEYIDKKEKVDEVGLCEIASCCLLGLDFLHAHHIMHGVIVECRDNGIEHQAIESVLQ